MSRLTHAMVMAAFLAINACGPLEPGAAKTPSPNRLAAQAKDEARELDTHRGNVEASPGNLGRATAFARWTAKVQARPRTTLHKAELVDEAVRHLDAVQGDDQERAAAWAVKGDVYRAASYQKEAAAAYESSLALAPTMHLVPGMLDLFLQDPKQLSLTCEAIGAGVTNKAEVLRLLSSCAERGDDLSWANPDDLDFYREERAIKVAKRRRDEEVQAGRKPLGGQASVETPVRISLYNACPQDVVVFRGEMHDDGSLAGRFSKTLHTSGTAWTYFARADDRFCFFAKSGDDKPAACLPSVTTSNWRVDKGCKGFQRR